MIENTKKLESLSYEPFSLPPAVKEKITAIIEPETRVEKPKVISQQPNQNLMIIEEIEGLLSQVNDKLDTLKIVVFNLSDSTPRLVSRAIEEIDLFQKTTLFEIRRSFE